MICSFLNPKYGAALARMDENVAHLCPSPINLRRHVSTRHRSWHKRVFEPTCERIIWWRESVLANAVDTKPN